MRTRILERKIILNKPRNEVFHFFQNAENLNTLTPPELSFEVLTPIEKIKEGDLIDYNINIFGWKVSWKTLISRFDAPNLFIDEQVNGPYLKWVHYHIFESDGDKTIMTDRVFFKVPGLIFEPVIYHLIIKSKLKQIFDYRESMCKKLF